MLRHNTRPILSTLMLVMAFATTAHAQIKITAPSHGDQMVLEVLTINGVAKNPWISVAGEVTWTGKDKPRIQVMGAEVDPARITGSGSTWQFSHDLSIPLDPTLGGGPWPPGFPYESNYTTPQIISLPLLAELLDDDGKGVTFRDRIVIHNTALYRNANAHWTGGNERTITAQITDSGADVLSKVHLSTLPWPDTKTFNQHLNDARRATPKTTKTLKTLACAPLYKGHPLVGTAPYKAAKQDAHDERVAYNACLVAAHALPRGTQAAILACKLKYPCVRDKVEPWFFEACVGRITADLRDLATGPVERADIRFRGAFPNGPDRGGVGVYVALSGPEALVQAKLSDVTIRWIGSTQCQNRIQAKAKHKDLTKPAVDAWRTCSDIRIDADDVHTTPAKNSKDSNVGFRLGRDKCTNTAFSGLECLSVTRSWDVPFTLSKPRSIALGATTCLQPWIADKARKTVEQLYDPIGAVIASAWYHGGKKHGQARALDRLLTPLELTDRVFTGHDLVANLAAVDTFWDPSGLIVDYITSATANLTVSIPTQVGMFHQSITDLTSLLDGKGYDAAYVVTTPLLNQVLRARSATKLLNFDTILTGSDWLFPVATKSAANGGQLAPVSSGLVASLTKKSASSALDDDLARLALADLLKWMGSDDYTLVVRRTLAPFTAMEHRETACANDRCPVQYEAAQFEWTLYREDELILRAHIDFRQGDLSLSFQASPTPDIGLLQVGLKESIWTATVIESALPSCPMATRADKQACERVFEQQLAKAAGALMHDRMAEILSELPSPDWYDAAGNAAVVRTVGAAGRVQAGQNIMLFGVLK